MSKQNNLTDFLTDLAEAIREKKGTQALINPQDFSSEIASIQTGGEQPQLFAPTISVGGNDVLTSDNGQNGGFSTTLKLYQNNQTYLTDLTNGQLDLDNYFANAGTYLLSVKASANLFEESNFSNQVTYKKIITPAASASVRNLGAQNPSDIIVEIGTGFPTTFEEVTVGNDVFIKFPTFYRRIDRIVDNQITAFTVSTTKIDNDFVPYPCFNDYINGGVLPYVLIGKYMSSDSSAINSVSGTPVRISEDTAITQARNKGTGYQTYDWQFHKLFMDLKLIIEGDIRFTYNQDTVLGVSNFNILDTEAGVYVCGYGYDYSQNKWVIEYDPRNYTDSYPTGATKHILSYTPPSTNGNVKKLGYDANHPFANFTTEVVGINHTDFKDYYCSQENKTTSGIDFHFRNSIAGRSLFGTLQQSFSSHVRLCYRPINI